MPLPNKLNFKKPLRRVTRKQPGSGFNSGGRTLERFRSYFMSIFNLFRKKRKRKNISGSYQKKERPIIESPINIEVAEIPAEPINKKEERLTLESISDKTIDFYISYFAKEELSEEIPDFSYDSLSDILLEKDPLFDEAARIVVLHQQGSTSLIQRKFSLGYNRAGRLMDQLEAAGIVGAVKGSSPREVFIVGEYALEKLLDSLRDNNDFSSFPYGLDQELRSEIRIKHADSISLKKDEMREEYHRKKSAQEEAELENKKEIIRKELLEKEKIRQFRREVKKELVESGHIQQTRKRESIPQDIQDKVWIRDGGKCVVCGSSENLEFDHIIPFSKGGSNTYRNLQLLCEKCNRQKSNNIG